MAPRSTNSSGQQLLSPPPRSLSPSSGGSSDHNAGVSPAPTGRVAAVCRQDVARLQEGKVTKWRTIVVSGQTDKRTR